MNSALPKLTGKTAFFTKAAKLKRCELGANCHGRKPV